MIILKMRRKSMEIPAALMIMLVIMLPFHVSEVFAQDSGEQDTINILNIHGGDGIDDVRRSEDDFTNIKVEIFSSKTLSAQDIQLQSTAAGGSSTTFDTCTEISPYTCEWESQPNDLPVNAYSFYACIGPCDNCFSTSCKKRATIYVDGVPPSVDSFSVEPEMTNGDEMELEYSIEDRSCTAAKCSGHCSGISKIEIYDAGDDGSQSLVDTISISADDTEGCSIEDTYDFSASSVSDGERYLCLKPYDRFDQAKDINTMGPECVAIKKDDSMPSFGQVRVMDPSETYDLDYVEDTGSRARFIVNLTVSELFSLEDDRIKADLSEIGGSTHDKIPCRSLGSGYWKCVKDMDVKVSGSSQSIQLSAIDDGGNNNTQVFDFDIETDSTPPSVDKITTRNELDGNGYLKAGNDIIIAQIDESGAGMDQNNVFFDTSDRKDQQAECSASSGKWVCHTNITAGGDYNKVTIHGKDDAGNSFAETKKIPVDSEKPDVIEVILRNTNSNPYFVTNDDVLVKARIKDNNAVADDSGEYDVSITPIGFADPNPKPAESCELNESNDVWTCQWTLMNLAPGDVKMWVNASDFVGNTMKDYAKRFVVEYLEPSTGLYERMPESDVEVYEVEDGTPDYWNVDAGTPSPSFVDSSTTQMIEHDVWIPLRMRPRSGASLFSVELAGCKGDDFNNYAKSAVLVRPRPDSLNPYLRVTLKRGALEVDELNFECAVNTVSKHNEKITDTETDEFEAAVPVKAHGELSSQVKQDLLSASNSWLVKASWIDTINQFLDLATRLCGLIKNLAFVARSIAQFSTPVAQFCEKFPLCYPAAASAGAATKASHLSLTGATKFIHKFCEYASCRETLWGDWLQGDDDAKDDASEWKSLGLAGKADKEVNTWLGETT
ncbi:MAG: hypothetical protein R6U32_07515, partial [Candidatus Woesearchaeota archaeon]